MALPASRLTLELVPHCASVPRDGWAASHDIRPLTEQGLRQAAALADAIGLKADGIYSSPTVRCRQTVAPLAAAVGLPVHDLAELYEAGDFTEPAAQTQAMPEIMARAVGGAWAAGRMLRAVSLMTQAHPHGRVIAASHGDSIPILLSTLSAAFDLPLPPWIGRGGWYTLHFAPGNLTITPHTRPSTASG
jgi:broad specificity phosphatase PhoE